MIRRLLLAGFGLAVGVAAVSAQTRAGGVVERPGAGEGVREPVAGVRVVLHKVGRATQGPIDTSLTDARGRFSFRFSADSTASFLVSARFAGIEYFSTPLAINPGRPDTAIVVLVYDTTSTASVHTRSRTLIVGAADAIGARTVIDWIVLSNRGTRTKIGVDSSAPTWASTIAAEARNPQVGDARLSQISRDAVEFRADSVLVTAPLAPGDKELFLQYEIPPSQPRLTLSLAGVDSAEIFLEESALRPPVGWTVTDSQAFEGRRFTRLTRTAAAADRLELRLRGPGIRPEQALPWMVGATALALGVLGWTLLRRRPVAVAAESPVWLADEIAQLDRRLEQGGDDSQLRERRAALLARLRVALAGVRGHS